VQSVLPVPAVSGGPRAPGAARPRRRRSPRVL
jgi:hypothetical protein